MDDIRFSKFMVTVLRHSAVEKGLQITKGGYISVDDILGLPESEGKTERDVENIVRKDKKGRFRMETIQGVKHIKATQGHTLKVSEDDLEEITRPTDVIAVLHGTRSRNWSSIKSQGLSRMKRQHIHFAESETGAKSGFPTYCDLVVEVDLAKALRGGIKFFKSANGVILTEGNDKGFVPPAYFKKVYYLHTGETLPF